MKVEVWGRTKSYRFNDQFDIDFLPQDKEKEKRRRKKKSDQQPGWGEGAGEYNQLPVQSPSCRLTRFTIT